MSELSAELQTTPSSLQRELKSLTASGILRERREGNRLYFRAETESPIFEALKTLIERTVGIEAAAKAALTPFFDRIECAFIYGSLASGKARAESDVDLMIVGAVGLAELSPILRRLEKQLRREFNATCYGADEFRKKLAAKNHFLTTVVREEKIYLKGDCKDELDNLAGEPNDSKPRDQR